MANNTLRMSGLNSGLDTEAIVNALTAATKNKINKNQRSILTLQAQQDAYRTIIDKFNAFKNKYFDMLNIGTCLKSKTLFGSYKSTLTSSTGTDFVPGVTVTSSTNANEASYDVTVKTVATQSNYKSSRDTGKAMNFDNCRDSSKEFAMKVTANNKSVYVTFKGGSDEQIREQINEQLRDAFGVSNKDENGVAKNLVSLGEDNKFVSADKSSVVTTKPALYATEQNKELGDLESGSNSFTITVDGVSKTVTFSTVSKDYFDKLFKADGTLKTEDELKEEFSDDEQAEQLKRLATYKQVVLNQREGEVFESYQDWWDGLSDDDKKAFAEQVAKDKYQNALNDIENTYLEARKAKAELAAYNQYLEDNDLTNDDLSLADYLEDHPLSAEDYEAFEQTEEGKALLEDRETAEKDLLSLYNGYSSAVVTKEVNAAYDKQFELAKEAAKMQAWKEAHGGAEPTEAEQEDYENFTDFTFTREDFEAHTEEVGEDGEVIVTYTNEFYKAYETEKENIEKYYSNPDKFTVDLDGMSERQRMALYDEYIYSKVPGQTEEDYINNYTGQEGLTAAQEAAYQFNKANIENNLESISISSNGGFTELEVDYDREGNLSIKGVRTTRQDNEDGTLSWIESAGKFSITANVGSKNDFGFDTTDVSGTASQVSTTSKLNELGLEPDEDGNYSFSINGVSFSFSGDTTISEMMKKVNASTAGVKMTYTTLTNQFVLTSNEYGTGVDIRFQDGGQGLLTALGFASSFDSSTIADGDEYVGEFNEGTNTTLTINGEDVETTSNSYTVDGTTFTFTQAAVGQRFTNEVSRDYSKAMDTIKSFVEDYNKLIEDIYGYVDEEPNKDYYFLTDDDIDEMGLSETQQAKWEKMAQKGLLYRDSTLTDIMSKLRSVLYTSVDAADGSKVGLYTLGITTSSDYTNHGKLVFDDTKDFEAIFEKYADEFTELFTNTETGIAYQLERVIDNATRTTGGPGERGSLVDKAGVSGTASATSNAIYNKIKSLQDVITSLQRRYEQQQDRYWKIYGNMETMMGNLNSQTSYINQLLGNF